MPHNKILSHLASNWFVLFKEEFNPVGLSDF